MRLALTLSPGLKEDSRFHLVVLDWERQELIDQHEEHSDFFGSSHKGFAGASLVGDRLFAVDEVHLYEFSLNPLRRVRKVSHRLLNDAHHVAVVGGRVLVANSGLDTIEEFNLDFEHVQTHFLLRKNGRSAGQFLSRVRRTILKGVRRRLGWNKLYRHLPNRQRLANLNKFVNPARYHQPGLDVRRCDFRPHYLHPNHVWGAGPTPLVTLCNLGMIVELDSGRVVTRNLGAPHDGLASGRKFFVTDCATNELVVFPYDPVTGELGPTPERVPICGSMHEAFLRGVACDSERIFVGLTARRGRRQHATARIRALEPGTWRNLGEFTVPQQLGHSVYSLVDVTQQYS